MKLYQVTVRMDIRATSENDAYEQAFNDLERMMDVGNEDGHLEDYVLDPDVEEVEEKKVGI